MVSAECKTDISGTALEVKNVCTVGVKKSNLLPFIVFLICHVIVFNTFEVQLSSISFPVSFHFHSVSCLRMFINNYKRWYRAARAHVFNPMRLERISIG